MPHPRPHIASVSGTAFVTAVFRMWGQRGYEPLYHDDITPLLVDREAVDHAREAARRFPHAPDMIRLRTRYFDDALNTAIVQGVRQVVIAGSGLDTRATRIGGDGVQYFEIDRGETLKFKQAVLHRHGHTPRVHYIAGDYVHSDIATLLAGAGFDPSRPAFFLWEGNTTYLEVDTVHDVLAHMAGAAAAPVSVALDFMHERVILGTTGSAELTAYIAYLERMGAPWRSGFDDIAPLATSAGLRVREHATCSALASRYQPALPLASPLFDHYSVCTLISA
ncbi:MAG: SAM-dependent methyltransferase [Nitrospirota bacterium]|nr:SAM-dependent methyltransferase [Nitrospirota bacterium]